MVKVIGSTQPHAGVTDGPFTGALTTTRNNLPHLVLKDKESVYRVRRLTPVEYERLQGFPDGWTEFGVDGEPISNTQRYKCLGNAVTTNVITHIFNNWDLI